MLRFDILWYIIANILFCYYSSFIIIDSTFLINKCCSDLFPLHFNSTSLGFFSLSHSLFLRFFLVCCYLFFFFVCINFTLESDLLLFIPNVIRRLKFKMRFEAIVHRSHRWNLPWFMFGFFFFSNKNHSIRIIFRSHRYIVDTWCRERYSVNVWNVHQQIRPKQMATIWNVLI